MFWNKVKTLKFAHIVKISSANGSAGNVTLTLKMRSAPEQRLERITGVVDKGDFIIFESKDGGGAIVAKHDFVSAVVV